MSLRYIIDGYNLTKHRVFFPPRKYQDPKFALIDMINTQHLCGSLKNQVTIVFDGYPTEGTVLELSSMKNIEVIFSADESADDKIKRLIEKDRNPKTLIIVSDDRQIQFFSSQQKAAIMGVEEFLLGGKKQKIIAQRQDTQKIGYENMEKINKEFRRLWLKEN